MTSCKSVSKLVRDRMPVIKKPICWLPMLAQNWFTLRFRKPI
jgi:hypothetical protein